jgi:hypothetical protein
MHASMLHEHDCPAADSPLLARLGERLGTRVEYELVEAMVEVAA